MSERQQDAFEFWIETMETDPAAYDEVVEMVEGTEAYERNLAAWREEFPREAAELDALQARVRVLLMPALAAAMVDELGEELEEELEEDAL